MKIQMIALDKLKPAENNPKNHPKKQIDLISRSIKEFGFNQPIVVDKGMEIIAGHGRYFAAKKLKLAEVPVFIAENLTAEQKEAYKIADNRMNELGKWDRSKLQINLKSLDIKGFNIALTGFETTKVLDKDEKPETCRYCTIHCPRNGRKGKKK